MIPVGKDNIKKSVSILLVFLLILSSLFVFLLAGCNNEEPAPPEPEPTPEQPKPEPVAPVHDELLQIVAAALKSPEDADSYKADTYMAITMDTKIESAQNKMESILDIKVIADKATNSMKVTSNMSVSMGFIDVMQNIFGEVYVFPDYIYIKIDLLGAGQEWTKIPAVPEITETFDLNLFEDDLKVLESPAGIEFIGYETCDGSECYVLKLIPNDEKLLEFAQEQQPDDINIAWEDITDISDIFKNMNYFVRISKDTGLLKRFDVSAKIDFSDYLEQAPDATDAEMIFEVNGTTRIYDYNVPVSIILPDEAANAVEISPGEFSGG